MWSEDEIKQEICQYVPGVCIIEGDQIHCAVVRTVGYVVAKKGIFLKKLYTGHVVWLNLNPLSFETLSTTPSTA